MAHFIYGSTEIEHLKRVDQCLGDAIDRIGLIKREITPDPFTALVFSIVGQQVSNKAATTVRQRLQSLLSDISPAKIEATTVTAIRSCGLSLRKATYIKGIAQAALSGEVRFDRLHTMDDQEIVRQLSSLYGVGEWTAEMLLIFSLGRLDVVSYRDLAIHRGMKKLYRLEDVSREVFQLYRQRYSPYGSVASLYLWAIAAQ